MRTLGLVVMLVGLWGCTPYGKALHDTVVALNDRQIRSCVYLSGMYRAFVSVQAIVATGGNTLAECQGAAMLPGMLHPAPGRCENCPEGDLWMPQ
jgi:hypothetical protein